MCSGFAGEIAIIVCLSIGAVYLNDCLLPDPDKKKQIVGRVLNNIF